MSDPEAQKNMAWVLATCPETRIRAGARAVQLAERANSNFHQAPGSDYRGHPGGCLAEAGRFDDAIRAAEAAQQLAINAKNTALAQGIRSHFELPCAHSIRDFGDRFCATQTPRRS